MKILYKIFICILFPLNSLLSQLLFQGNIGKFQSASSFSYNPAGFIFITDGNTNELIKIDTLGKRLNYIGGYGWENGSFDNPVDVYSTTLNIYVADKNNNRIQIFDKDLNFLSEFSNEGDQEETFRYPLSCGISSTGELFVLDGENKKVLRYDQNGRFLQQFGSFDSGDYVLSDPLKLAITSDNKIVVLDNSELVFFDQFGTGLTRLSVGENIRNLNITFNKLVITSTEKVFAADLYSESPRITELDLPEYENSDFVEGMMIGNTVYILTPKTILVFKIKKG